MYIKKIQQNSKKKTNKKNIIPFPKNGKTN